MILIKCKPENRPVGFFIVAQNPKTYALLGFAESGNPYAYDTDHTEFDGHGRYKPRNGDLPNTLAELEVEFFNLFSSTNSRIAKANRDSGKLQPITITIRGTESTFDLDEVSQNNIRSTVQNFAAAYQEAIKQGWTEEGTIPWVLSDNTVIGVTADDLNAVSAAGVARGMKLHMEYSAIRAGLERMIPEDV